MSKLKKMKNKGVENLIIYSLGTDSSIDSDPFCRGEKVFENKDGEPLINPNEVRLNEEAFSRITTSILDAANEHSAGVFALTEGGYSAGDMKLQGEQINQMAGRPNVYVAAGLPSHHGNMSG